MTTPLVTVVCLCYNHEKFVEEAVRSVVNQSYRNIEIILVDDASTDGSPTVISDILKRHPEIKPILLAQNLGNCAAFNKGLALAKGEFIIDFATDDVMMLERIAQQVKFFSSLNDSYGVAFTDALYIDERGKTIRAHFEYLYRKGLIRTVPEGDIYADLIATYFIPSPTMMVRKKVFDAIGGYDDELTYEDFDFWVRSSRMFKYAFLNETLTKIRKVSRSMSTGWYKQGDQQLYSTYLVCRKAIKLNRTEHDHAALTRRVKFELRQSVFSENHVEAALFYELLKDMKRVDSFDSFLFGLDKLRLPLRFLRQWYHRLRYR